MLLERPRRGAGVQGYLSRVDFSPAGCGVFNLWPPVPGAGVRVTHIGRIRQLTVELRARLLNRNFVGTLSGPWFAMGPVF